MAKFKVIHPISHGMKDDKGERISKRFEPAEPGEPPVTVDGDVFGKSLPQLIAAGSLVPVSPLHGDEKKAVEEKVASEHNAQPDAKGKR